MKDELTGKVQLYRESDNGCRRFVIHEVKFDLEDPLLKIEQVDQRYFSDEKLFIKVEIYNEVRDVIDYLKAEISDLEELVDQILGS